MKALYSIVAMKFIPGAEEAIKKVATGSPVYLVREPDNPHDAGAVAVWSGEGVKLGYLPKAKNSDVGRLIDRFGTMWSPLHPVLALDQAEALDQPADLVPVRAYRGIAARFLRSPNSGYPQVEVEE